MCYYRENITCANPLPLYPMQNTGMFFLVVFEETETEADVASRLGVIFMSTMFIGVICFQTVIPSGYKERIVFYREQASQNGCLLSFLACFLNPSCCFVFITKTRYSSGQVISFYGRNVADRMPRVVCLPTTY